MKSWKKQLFVFGAALGLALGTGNAYARYQASLCECVHARYACDAGDLNACRQLEFGSCYRFPTLYGWEEACGVNLP